MLWGETNDDLALCVPVLHLNLFSFRVPILMDQGESGKGREKRDRHAVWTVAGWVDKRDRQAAAFLGLDVWDPWQRGSPHPRLAGTYTCSLLCTMAQTLV